MTDPTVALKQDASLPPIVVRIWRQLRPKRKQQFFLLIVLMVIGSFAEIVSIGSVVPLLGVLMVPDKIFAYPLVREVATALNLATPHEMVLPIVLAFIALAIGSAAVRLMMIYATTRYSFALGGDIGVEMYRRTLYQPYIRLVSRNSSELIDSITAKAWAMIGNILMPILNLISSALLVFGVVLALIVINPILTVSVGVFIGGLYFFIIFLTRRALQRNGETIARNSTKLIRALQEGLGGIRDVLIDNTQEAHTLIFQRIDHPLRVAHGRNLFISASPRYIVETVGIIAIAVGAYFAGRQAGGVGGAIPTLGALALGAQRLLPILQQAYASFASIRGTSAAAHDVLNVLEQPLPEDRAAIVEPIEFEREISLRDMTFSYDAGEPVLSGANLSLKKGKRYGFVGTTGSGKSTLLDVLMGLLEPTSGTLAIDGRPITLENRRRWQRRVAHVPQAIFLSDASVAENIAFGVASEEIDMVRVEQAARMAQIADTIETLPMKYRTMVGERGTRLSGGQRQRIGIARALYKQADVLIFDEATSALDTETEAAVMRSINSLSGDRTILIVAHRVSTLANCDEIFEVAGGKIQAKSPAEGRF